MSKKKLGKYEILDRIGRGGMAEVYRGYHPSLDRYVAIKLLHPFLADDPEFKDRFENEARNVARLKHPNIVQVYDFDFDPDSESYYMVMELINGPTLKDQLFELETTKQRLPVAEVIRIVKSAAEALAYAHQRNMIHRDVKPANLMIDEDSRLVLTDFGIAKIVTGTVFTMSGGMVGTPAYMAPEQGLGESGDERSDIYSLGVILFQLVTGRLPYDADTPLAVILKHLNEPLPIPHNFVEDISPDLEKIICRSLEKDPQDRYQTSAEMAYELDRLDNTGRRHPLYDTPTRLNATMPFETDPVAPTEDERALLVAAAAQTLDMPLSRAAGRLRPAWVLALVTGLVMLAALAMIGFGGPNTPLGSLMGNNDTDIPDLTQTALALAVPPGEPSLTPTGQLSTTPIVEVTETPIPSSTPTATVSPTLTETPTLTPTLTETPTFTPSPNLTGTALAEFFETQAAYSPTPNMTQTLAVCDLEYIVVSPEQHNIPPSINAVNNPRLVASRQNFSFDLVFRNVGSCAWPKGARLTYNQRLSENPDETLNLEPLENACADTEVRGGLNFAAQEQPNFYLNDEVDVMGESGSVTFTGTAPNIFGCYYSVWDLLYPNSDVPVGRPLILAIRVWGGG